MKLLITGKNGQLGSELQELTAQYPEHHFRFLDREEMDLSNPAQITQVLEREKPDTIINAGAYTAVDLAETESTRCNAINHIAVKTMADWAKVNNAKMIHVSTDYVFNGTSSIPLKETDPADPINTYGQTKKLGEEALIISEAPYIIIRTAWVYSTYGANFVKTMRKLMTEKEEIGVVADQIGSPTYARDLAKVILHIATTPTWHQGIYHYSNEGQISWYEFATAIKEISGYTTKINPLTSAAFPTKAQRPKYSLLDKTKIKTTYHIQIPHWRESLQEMLLKLDRK